MSDNLTSIFYETFLSTLPCGPCPTCEYIQDWPWSMITQGVIFLFILIVLFLTLVFIGYKLFNKK